MILAKDYVELDPYIAVVDIERCQGTGICVEECLYAGAITLQEMEIDGRLVKRAKVNPALCKGCGACVAVCPSRALNVNGWTLNQFEAQVDALAMDLPVTVGSEV